MTDRTALYCKYYRGQYGGEIPMFRGGQHGAGIGDILRGVARYAVPAALRGVSSFASHMLKGHAQGASYGSAAKSAILPALGSMVGIGSDTQSGGAAHSSTMFKGINGIPFESQHHGEYKRAGVKRKKAVKHKKTKKGTKKVRHDHDDTYNF